MPAPRQFTARDVSALHKGLQPLLPPLQQPVLVSKRCLSTKSGLSAGLCLAGVRSATCRARGGARSAGGCARGGDPACGRGAPAARGTGGCQVDAPVLGGGGRGGGAVAGGWPGAGGAHGGVRTAPQDGGPGRTCSRVRDAHPGRHQALAGAGVERQHHGRHGRPRQGEPAASSLPKPRCARCTCLSFYAPATLRSSFSSAWTKCKPWRTSSDGVAALGLPSWQLNRISLSTWRRSQQRSTPSLRPPLKQKHDLGTPCACILAVSSVLRD